MPAGLGMQSAVDLGALTSADATPADPKREIRPKFHLKDVGREVIAGQRVIAKIKHGVEYRASLQRSVEQGALVAETMCPSVRVTTENTQIVMTANNNKPIIKIPGKVEIRPSRLTGVTYSPALLGRARKFS